MSKLSALQLLSLSLLLLVASPSQGIIDWTMQEKWGADCDGSSQSPIDIRTRSMDFCPWQFYFHIETARKDFPYVEQGQSLTVKAEGINYISMYEYKADKGKTEFSIFETAQFHYHTPSEHRINGKLLDLQMHFVHAYSEKFTKMYLGDNLVESGKIGELAVIGILFKEDPHCEEDLFDRFLPTGHEISTNLFSALACIEDKFFYHYKGSLTTPPCSEIVSWFVLKNPLPIRPQNLKRFQKDINDGKPNNREVQDLNGRNVILTSPKLCYYWWHTFY